MSRANAASTVAGPGPQSLSSPLGLSLHRRALPLGRISARIHRCDWEKLWKALTLATPSPRCCSPGTRPSPIQLRAEAALKRLVVDYAATGYGRCTGKRGRTFEEYRSRFPIAAMRTSALIQRVLAGESELLLSEEAIGWADHPRHDDRRVEVHSNDSTDLRLRISAGGNDELRDGHERYDLFSE